ncbi:gamma-glutamylcyclotransferase family protein [Planctomicrobium sp. SH664]|uniref:gamma-glutamylcyclotransferase family protein n=1 Tax=Planctomicrobium sp. SH664 TaxID=3448125 RepID=UPI003F5C27E3
MSTSSRSHRVFVYGTLKRGFCRHSALVGERFVGTARTQPLYRMVNLGTYPGLFRVSQEGLSIVGEVWDVSAECLSRLDEIEGIAEGEYCREPIQLIDVPEPVDAYFSLHPRDRYPDCGTEWV